MDLSNFVSRIDRSYEIIFRSVSTVLIVIYNNEVELLKDRQVFTHRRGCEHVTMIHTHQ